MLRLISKLRLRSLFQRNQVEPCVCCLDSDPQEFRYAIREITLDKDNVVIGVSAQALSPKASSSEQLRVTVQYLLNQAQSGPISCGETGRRFSQAQIESWLSVIGKPVFRIRA